MGGLRLAVVVCMAVGACGQNFMPTGPMTTARVNQTTVLLANGDVLLAGGGVGSSPSLSTAAIYDPATGTFTPTGSLQEPRTDAVATLLTAGALKGQAILIGGNNGDSDNAYASTEIYDPVAGSFRFGPMMPFAIGLPRAVSLPDGKIVVFGLEPDPSCRPAPCISSWTVYDPAANAFTSSGEMPVDVSDFEAAALQDNKVLIAGGLASGAVTATAALFDPGNGAFTPTGPMQTPRARGIAVTLSDGSVLIAGGVENVAPSGSLTSVEIYSPKTGKFSPAGNLPASLTLVGSSATLLSNGEVLLAGGGSPTLSSLADAEIYDPVHRTFISAGQMDAARSRFTATLLQNGNVLIAGGLSFPPVGSQATTDLASAELYAPASAPHPNFFLQASPNPASIGLNQKAAQFTISVNAIGGFDRPVALGCAYDNPACAFSPAEAGVGSPATLTFTDLGFSGTTLAVDVVGASGDDTARYIHALPLTIHFTAPGLLIAPVRRAFAVQPGGSAGSVVYITSARGFSGAVHFSCTGAPALATCSVLPSSVNLSPGQTASVTLAVTTTAPQASSSGAAAPPGFPPAAGGALLLAAALLGLSLLVYRKPAFASRALLAVVLVAAIGMLACAGSPSPRPVQPTSAPKVSGTPQGTSTLTLTATGAIGTAVITQSAQFILDVD